MRKVVLQCPLTGDRHRYEVAGADGTPDILDDDDPANLAGMLPPGWGAFALRVVVQNPEYPEVMRQREHAVSEGEAVLRGQFKDAPDAVLQTQLDGLRETVYAQLVEPPELVTLEYLFDGVSDSAVRKVVAAIEAAFGIKLQTPKEALAFAAPAEEEPPATAAS